MKSSQSKKSRNYQISLNRKQLCILNEALDLHSRIHAGQISEVEHVLHGSYDHEEVTRLLDKVKTLIFPDLKDSCSYGLSAKEDSRIAYEMHSDVRRFLAYEANPKGGITVDFDPTFKTSSEPNIVIKYDDNI